MAIEVRNASFKYPNGFVAVQGLNLTIQEGERLAIVGQNGAGKTTAVKMLNGLYRPFEGDVIVDGKNTKNETTASIARMVGYVFQNPDDQIFNKSVREELEYMPRYFKLGEAETKKRLDFAADLAGITEFLNSNPYDLPYPIRKFVAIGAVIATNPKYIILDEPTAGQDKRGIEVLARMIEVLQENGVATVTITHDMEFAVSHFPRVIAMAHKNILVDGSSQDVFWNDAVVAEAKIKKPVIAELADKIGVEGQILFCEDLVAKLP